MKIKNEEEAQAFAHVVSDVADRIYKELDEREFSDHIIQKMLVAAMPALITVLTS